MGRYDNWLKNLRTKRVLASLCVVGVMGATNVGCFGGFHATRKLWTFNKEVSGNKFVQWAVFLGLTIIPAYALFGLGDVLIFNTLEFWTDSNPLAGGWDVNQTERWVRISPTEQLHLTRDLETGRMTSELVRDGVVVGTRVFELTADGFEVRNAEGEVVARVKPEADGSVSVFGQGGEKVAAASASEVEVLAAKFRQGGAQLLAAAVSGGAGLACTTAVRP